MLQVLLVFLSLFILLTVKLKLVINGEICRYCCKSVILDIIIMYGGCVFSFCTVRQHRNPVVHSNKMFNIIIIIIIIKKTISFLTVTHHIPLYIKARE